MFNIKLNKKKNLSHNFKRITLNDFISLNCQSAPTIYDCTTNTGSSVCNNKNIYLSNTQSNEVVFFSNANGVGNWFTLGSASSVTITPQGTDSICVVAGLPFFDSYQCQITIPGTNFGVNYGGYVGGSM